MRYGITVDMSKDALMGRTINHFEKMGLTMVEHEDGTARLEGADGYIAISVEGSSEVELKIDTDRYDREVKQFIQRLGL